MQPDFASCYVTPAPEAQRIGLKGRDAAAALAREGLEPPAAPNSWTPCTLAAQADGRLLRLGHGEYLLERDGTEAIDTTTLVAAAQACFLLLRTDRSFLVGGEHCEALLAEVCNIDFRALDVARRGVVLTLLAGVAVTVIKEDAGATARYRLWCDPSFGDYLWQVLRQVLTEGGGRVTGDMTLTSNHRSEHPEVPT